MSTVNHPPLETGMLYKKMVTERQKSEKKRCRTMENRNRSGEKDCEMLKW